jgi:hypothetical protein
VPGEQHGRQHQQHGLAGQDEPADHADERRTDGEPGRLRAGDGDLERGRG